MLHTGKYSFNVKNKEILICSDEWNWKIFHRVKKKKKDPERETLYICELQE